MISAVMDKQLMITVNNRVGTLAEVTKVLASSNINLIAICAQAIENTGHIMFVTEDNKTAKQILKTKKYEIREEEVVMVTLTNKPGALQAVAQKIADAGIDLTLIYGSVEKEAVISRLVMIAEDNRALLLALQR